jgi:hypothetical protein
MILIYVFGLENIKNDVGVSSPSMKGKENVANEVGL